MMSFMTENRLLPKTMNKDEKAVLAFLEKDHPHLVPSFSSALSKGREGILRRFAGSLLREDVFGLFSAAADLQKNGSAVLLNGKEQDTYWNEIEGKLQEGVTYKLYTLAEDSYIAFPLAAIYGFRRVDIEGELLYVEKSRVKAIESASELIDLLAAYIQDTGTASWENLKLELENGSANLALSYTFYEQDMKTQKREAAFLTVHTALDYAAADRTEKTSASLFFEQLSVEGHNLHPGAKTKMGMKPEHLVQYAPEFRGTFPLTFAAIHKEHASWNELEEELLLNAYPGLKKAAQQQLNKLHRRLDDYIVVPVHPWQMTYEVEAIYKEEIARHLVVPIPSFSIPCRATSSFRTVDPCESDEPFSFKTAVNSQMTSTVRSISPYTAMNAVPFTKMIRDVLARERALHQTFIPICETAGYHFKSEDPMKSRNLTAVLRENVNRLIEGEELAIVGSSLYALSPITNQPILAELVEQYAETKGKASLSEAGIHFLRDYAALILPGMLTLMTKYGIGLEGHLQNSLPVFEKGVPKRLFFRDWGGARIYRKRLQAQYGKADFMPGSMTITDSVEEMHNKVYYTVFQNHLGEVIYQLCKLYHIEEGVCWKEVRMICDRLFSELEGDVPKEWVELDKKKLYEPFVNHKALTLMRMMPKDGYHYASVPNPLHRTEEQKEGNLCRD